MIDTQKARKALTENEVTVINYLNKHGIDGELTVQTCTRTKFTIRRGSDGAEITFDLPARLYRAGYPNINSYLATVRDLIQPPKRREPNEVSEEEIARYMPGKWSPDYIAAIIAYVKRVKKVGMILYIVSEYDIEAQSCFRGSHEDLLRLDKFDGYDRAEESGHPLLVTEDKEKAEKLFAGKTSGFYGHGGIAYKHGFFYGEYQVNAPEDEDDTMPEIECVGSSDAPVEINVYRRDNDADWDEEGEVVATFSTYAEAFAERDLSTTCDRDSEYYVQ